MRLSLFTRKPGSVAKMQNQIKQISDLERLISKIASGKVSPREVVYLKESLDAITYKNMGFRKFARSGEDHWRQFA
jgi:DNA mismatch repair ATPase MutS